MHPSPYREAAAEPARRERSALIGDRDLLIPLAIFWCVSAFRVAMAIMSHETFDTGATLALVAVIVVPIALGRSIFESRAKKTRV